MNYLELIEAWIALGRGVDVDCGEAMFYKTALSKTLQYLGVILAIRVFFGRS